MIGTGLSMEFDKADVFFFLLGIAVGAIFAANWRGSGVKQLEIKKDPRLKSLLYVVGTGGGTWLYGLLQKSVENPERQFDLLMMYGIGVVLSALVFIAIVSVSISITCFRLSRGPMADRLPKPFHPVLEYFIHGYDAYKALCSIPDEPPVVLAREYRNYKLRMGLFAEMIAANLSSIHRYKANPTDAYRNELTEKFLGQICQLARHYMGDDREDVLIRANIMLRCGYATATPSQLAKLKFHNWGDTRRYTDILELHWYNDGPSKLELALGVRSDGRADALRWNLPGAPQAMVMGNELVVTPVQQLKFPKIVPTGVRDDIEEFLNAQGLTLFVSYPMLDGQHVNGVINIDTDVQGFQAGDHQRNREFTKLLCPFGHLLGSLYSS